MNKYIYLFFICIGLSFTACDESHLEVKSPDQLTGENFWRNESDAEGGLAAAYSQLECATSYWGFAEIKFTVELFPSDLIKLGNDALNYEDWFSIFNFNSTAGNTQTTQYWNIHYKGINYANQVIEKVGDMSEEQISTVAKDKIIAEARFLRAYYHLKLLLNWEKIILRDDYPKGLSSIDKGVSERSECWDFIIADFEAAATKLSESNSTDNIGRATKWTALGYLGKANLYYASENADATKYTAAKTAFTSVITSGNYSLESSFISMFNGINQNSDEVLFELQLTSNTDNGAFFKFPYHRWLKPAGMGGWDEIAGSDFLLQEFKKEGKTATDGRFDHRLYETLFFEDDYFNDIANPRIYGKTFNSWWDESGTPRNKTGFRKYLPETLEELNTNSIGNNIPLLRYADVLLMYAETLNELNETSAAIPYINAVRARAGMPAMTGSSKTDVTNQIEHERVCELAMEGSRFHDLRRWGKLNSTMTDHGRIGVSDTSHFFPIPESEINSNNAID
ncbi:RagB/SusD family nutrient uptake outer membrane protein [Labilibaculum antarcticum]|uniref:RagB/SusD family nutrient uptake outer membrane protein n=1 Tax=Labilibaculum antarcticum TaxID=1717717 RepID=A0A1Y1CG07_9BACT|nr:RagB/SusD family nutrient uptake outer membrane protein [Labilibaculum antarcticum]BAX79299.1 RagB/SusD family nutrient uptake outer membrane protein [Labilibaculum antarcticum]